MRKQALVHLHQLCYLLAERVEEDCDAPTETFDNYQNYDVHPHAIHLDKRSHRKATAILADGIVRTLVTHERRASGLDIENAPEDVVGESLN